MATLHPVILPDKVNKAGRHRVRIALEHRSRTAYIVTPIFLDQPGQLRDGRIIRHPDAQRLTQRLRSLVDALQDRLDSLPNIERYTCPELRALLASVPAPSTAATFQAVADCYTADLREEGRHNYADLIERNRRYFTEYTDGDLPLASITPTVIAGYERFLARKKGLGTTTVGMMLSRTRTIINRAIRAGDVTYQVPPFALTRIKAAPAREVAISVEAIKAIRDYDTPVRMLRLTRDLFMLSFYTGGANLGDLLAIDWRRNPVEYVRIKTAHMGAGDTVVIPVPGAARPIIEAWMDARTGRLDTGYKASYRNFYRALCRAIDRIATDLNIDKVVFYSARKTFAQLAADLGVPDAVIDYCLGHSDKARGVIRYYTKVRSQQAGIAISRVIDYLDHPDRYADYLAMRADIMMGR